MSTGSQHFRGKKVNGEDQGERLNIKGNQGSCGYQERWSHRDSTAQKGLDETSAICTLEILEDAAWPAS